MIQISALIPSLNEGRLKKLYFDFIVDPEDAKRYVKPFTKVIMFLVKKNYSSPSHCLINCKSFNQEPSQVSNQRQNSENFTLKSVGA